MMMNDLAKEVLICLVAAHFLGDFVFQTNENASTKKKAPILLKHAFIVAGFSYLLCGIWDLWIIPVIIFLTHITIDYVKIRSKKENAPAFIFDQTVHLAVILVIIILIIKTNFISIGKPSTFWVSLIGKDFLKCLILVAGLTICVKAGGILIGLAVKPFTEELQKEGTKSSGAYVNRGFQSGGKIIGYLERGLIFLFIFTSQPASVGFLIAAKSILRFGEIKDQQNRMEAEYIIIGTLMSFAYGLFIAYMTRFCLDRA